MCFSCATKNYFTIYLNIKICCFSKKLKFFFMLLQQTNCPLIEEMKNCGLFSLGIVLEIKMNKLDLNVSTY